MIATKHGGCPGFLEFEERFGSDAATEILERFTEELCSRGSQFGISISDVVNHDTMGDNMTATGQIEHDETWYEFDISSGSWNGTVVNNFELAEEPAEVDPSVKLTPPYLLQACLVSYLKSATHLQFAGGASMSALRDCHPTGRVSAAPRQVHELLKAVLGDIAAQSQDYAVDAIAAARKTLTSAQTAGALYEQLSEELRQHIEQTHAHSGWAGTPAEFFVAGLEPALQAKLF